jgi:hypothetical protein
MFLESTTAPPPRKRHLAEGGPMPPWQCGSRRPAGLRAQRQLKSHDFRAHFFGPTSSNDPLYGFLSKSICRVPYNNSYFSPQSFAFFYSVYVHLHQFSLQRSHKTVETRFFLILLLVGGRFWIQIQINKKNDRSGSGMPKNLGIRIRNTVFFI